MSPPIPTTDELAENIVNQIATAFNQAIPILPKNFGRYLGKVISAILISLYKFAGFVFLQMFIRYASDQEVTVNGQKLIPIQEWGKMLGAGTPKAATQAQLLIDITVEDQSGSLPNATALTSNLNGVTYITTSAIVLDSPVVPATIKAVADQTDTGGAGAQGNLNPGDIVSFVESQGKVAQDALVVSQVVTGANAEESSIYRQKVFNFFAQRPQGGALTDYKLWGLLEAGIIDIFVYTGDPNQMNVYAEATEASSGSPDGFPTPAQLLAIKETIEKDEDGLASRRPAGVLVNVFSISRKGFDVTISNLEVEDETTVKAGIAEQLGNFFWSRSPFIDGLTINPRVDRIDTTNLTGIVNTVVTAAGGSFDGLFFQVNGEPTVLPKYILEEGEKSKVVNINYTA
jgi:uncharacterized phage protein gp47/JayE